MKDFTKGNEAKIISQFTFPIILGSLFFQLYNIVNGAVVGLFLGKEALAAVGVVFPIIFLLVSLVIGIGMGGTVLVAQFSGAKDFQNLRKSVDTTYLMLLGMGFILTIIGYIFTPETLKLINLHEHKEVFEPAVIYMRVYLLGLVFMFGFNGVSSILRGMGNSKTPVYFLVASNILNLILSVIFICGFGWGIASSAWSSVISQGIAFICLNWYILKREPVAAVRFKNLKWDKHILRETFRIGLPTGLQQSFVALGQVALLFIVNGFGTSVIAAYSAVMRLDAFACMPAMSYSQGITSFVGQNLGAKKIDRVRKGKKATSRINIIIAIVIGLIFVIFGRQLMSIFSHDPEVIEIGYSYLLICGPFYILCALMFIYTGIFRGAGDTIVPMFITLLGLWAIRVPVAYFLSQISEITILSTTIEIGYRGIFWAIPMGWIFGFFASYWYFKKGNWRKAVVTQRKRKATKINTSHSQ